MSETENTNVEFVWGTGRRKTSVARVRIRKANQNGQIVVNEKHYEQYFPVVGCRQLVTAALTVTNTLGKYDIAINVRGGGPHSQAGAVLLGIARALCKIAPGAEDKLRDYGYLTRDSRMKERKKYGKRKARASFQFSKR